MSPNDEPASVLLEKIRAEKKSIGNETGAQKCRPLPSFDDKMARSYEIPSNWLWTRLDNVIFLLSGQHILAGDYNDEPIGIGYLTGPSDFGNINPVIKKWTQKPKVISKKNDILITVKGAGLGKCNIVDCEEVAISRQLMAIRCIVLDFRYVYLFVMANFVNFQSAGIGIAIPGLSRDFVRNMVFPLPPLNEQKRIVAKVDQLMALCDDLEAKLQKSQKRNDRLIEAAVAEMLAA